MDNFVDNLDRPAPEVKQKIFVFLKFHERQLAGANVDKVDNFPRVLEDEFVTTFLIFHGFSVNFSDSHCLNMFKLSKKHKVYRFFQKIFSFGLQWKP